jgi:hypothetical protein
MSLWPGICILTVAIVYVTVPSVFSSVVSRRASVVGLVCDGFFTQLDGVMFVRLWPARNFGAWFGEHHILS